MKTAKVAAVTADSIPKATAPDSTTSLADQIAARRKAMKLEELSEILGVAKNTLYDWVREGRLPSYRFGGAIRLDPKAVAQWMRTHHS